jgi:hypothetical protein
MFKYNGAYKLDSTERENVRHAILDYMANETDTMEASMRKAFEGEPYPETCVSMAFDIVQVIDDLLDSELNESFYETYDDDAYQRGQ